jgi:uncharacterized protein YhbP (UPF0306 family)
MQRVTNRCRAGGCALQAKRTALLWAVRVTGELRRIEVQGDDQVMIAFCSCFARRVKAARGANL